MKKSFSIICLILAMLMLLSACQNDKPDIGESEHTETDLPTEGDNFSLPNVKYGGETFKILSVTDYNDRHYLVRDEYEGDAITDTVVERTAYIEETYDVELEFVGQNNPVDVISNSHMGGGKEFDMIDPHPTEGIATLFTEGLLSDLRSLQYVSVEEPWYNQSETSGYTVDGKLYLAVSDLTLTGQNFAGLVYNKDLYHSLGEPLGDLYQLVDDGAWTLEKLLTLSETFGSDVNSDDIYDANDQYGLVYHYGYTSNYMYGAGQHVLRKNDEGVFELAFNNQTLTKVAESLNGTLYGAGNHTFVGAALVSTFPSSDLWKIFSRGDALCLTFDFGGLYTLLRDLTFRKGYLPMPKYDETQKDYEILCGAGFVGIPALVKNSEMSAVILEAMSYYSYKNLRPEFFESILMGKLAYDPADYKMLELMHEHKVFDIGYTLDSSGVATWILGATVIENKSTAVTAYMRGKKNQLNEIVNMANSLGTSGQE